MNSFMRTLWNPAGGDILKPTNPSIRTGVNDISFRGKERAEIMYADHCHTGKQEHHHHHENDHWHSDQHDHFHEHVCDAHTGREKNRDLKILQYMIEHNAEHAKEMRELSDRLRNAGKIQAAELVGKAAAGFEAANTELEKASDLLT